MAAAADGDTTSMPRTAPEPIESRVSYVDDKGDRFTAVTGLPLVRERILMVVDHLAFRVFTILLILFDVTLVIYSLAKGAKVGNRGNKP